ncbi:N-6 DNA methylase [Streptomyces sp. NBC_00160]|uniref:Eco57I restriction-modification methylase domain-containing protein n=1 Tax=Streptomyces sp. NBC_00160 TaxID=2903628 RepID=UPI00225791BA|nr:N-6 DNA methylase [Streptomyces sp. NBC_00160]MCX5303183.1 N-6 DNA methylase [Streptomyces sp. NBC_00160]
MLNITVAGTTLSTYYLSDPALFLREQRDRIGAEDATDGIRHAKRELRRLVADIDETSTAGDTRKRMLSWLSCFGWTFPGSLPAIEEPVLGRAHDTDGEPATGDLVSVLIAPPGQHLDASPTGRRAGKLRPQRQAEVCAREHRLPAVLLSNSAELRVIRRDPGLGGEASYLSVDLAGLAELGDDHEWRILWALLRPEAFSPDEEGELLWKRLEDASADAATAVSENLSGGVRTAISAIANGALHHWRQHDRPIPEPRALFADALKIAYRLLFVAYAEDRGLLPIGTPSYDSGYSLRALRKTILTADAAWEPDGSFLWSSLRAQWALLRDGTDAGELQITGFNGGLFDPTKCQLLDDVSLTVGDIFVRDAIDALSWTEAERSTIKSKASAGRRAVNYRELGVEQLGSIYEGLLSFEPQIADTPKVLARIGRGQSALVQVLDADRLPENAESIESYDTGTFYLFEASGQRKGSGSYYTARPLAHFVVGETLRPLVQDATPEEILNLRICDPAMGSGAFLVPAVHQLTEAYGEALARTGENLDHKLDDTERAVYRRLIVERCIYGVDLNPMAVELAKVSLWLTTAAAGKPLSFLDAHLRCGNAVVGAHFNSWAGVPAPAQGARVQRGGAVAHDLQDSLFAVEEPDLAALVRARQALAQDPSEDRLQVRTKEQRFARLLDGDDFTRLRDLGDWWVAPFFQPHKFKGNTGQWLAGHDMIKRGDSARRDLADAVTQVRADISPFHWEVEFPEVFFDKTGEHRTDAGFDAMIGNPPWEGITFKAAEFYGRFDPSYAFLKKKQEKIERQAELGEDPAVSEAREAAENILTGMKSFIKNSGNYEMLGTKGTYNLYRSFLERELKLLSPTGRIGVVIDSGVIGDAGTQYHRRELFNHCQIDRFVLFDNVHKIFPIDSREQFLLLVAQRGGETESLQFTSDVSKLEHLLDIDQRTTDIPISAIRAMAPETLAVPDARDAELLDLLSAIYGRRPLLLDYMENGEWQVGWGRELHIDDNKDCFSTTPGGIPLLEGKNIHQFVDNFAEPSYFLNEAGEHLLEGRARKRARRKNLIGVTRVGKEEDISKNGPRTGVLEVPADGYRPVLRETSSATNERTLIATIVPPGTAVAHKLHFFYRSSFDHAANGYRTILGAEAMAYVVGLLNSLVLDFIVRRKVTSTVSKSIMATLPIADYDLRSGPGAAVVRLSARLICRTSKFEDLAYVLGVKCGPLSTDEEYGLRAELDARVAHLYGLSATHLELILADFRQSADPEGSPVRPNEGYKQLVRDHFARLAG